MQVKALQCVLCLQNDVQSMPAVHCLYVHILTSSYNAPSHLKKRVCQALEVCSALQNGSQAGLDLLSA